MSFIDFLIKASKEAEKKEAAPPIPICAWPFERADRNSAIPFEAEFVSGAVTTHRGISHGCEKPSGSYSIIMDSGALARIRTRRAEKFEAMVWANEVVDEFFYDTFTNNHEECPAHSAIRNTMQKVGT